MSKETPINPEALNKLEKMISDAIAAAGTAGAALALAAMGYVDGDTIVLDGKRYKCDVIADDAVLTMQQNKIRYYPALRTKNAIFICPTEIDEKIAMAILILNNEYAGVFALSDTLARNLCNKLGGATGPYIHGTGGSYWFHYHAKRCEKAHCWFID